MMSETFKDRLLNYEVQPPASAWEAISADLSQNVEFLPISKKLIDYEATPPPNAWKEIFNAITVKEPVAIHAPTKLKLRPVYKMLAAAAVLGLVVTFGLNLNRSASVKERLSTLEDNKPKDKLPQMQQPLATESAPALSEKLEASEETDMRAPQAPVKIKKNIRESNKVLLNTKVKNPEFTSNDFGIFIAAKPIRNARGEIIQDTKIMNEGGNQYISITGPNGQQTKISSKFLHMLLFINDDSDIDEVDGYFDKTFLESLVWKSRFQDWRDKIIKTSLVPSSTNFMDILEFKDLITKDK